MTQTAFASNASPSLTLLDQNFTQLYYLRELISDPSYAAASPGLIVGGAAALEAKNAGYYPRFAFTKTSVGSWYCGGDGSGGNTNFQIGLNASVFLSVDSSGSINFGQSVPNLTNANGQSFVAGTGYQVNNHASGTASATAYVYFGYNGASIGTITQSGTTAVLYNTTSDARLKRNIGDAHEAGAIIDAIHVREFDWKDGSDHVTHGFIAQELVTVAPQAVKVGDDGEEVDEAWGVDPSKLVALLVKEVQCLRARVAALEG